MHDYHLRQADLLPLKQRANVNITIVGAGGIGSSVAIALAKMGIHNLNIYDPDILEDHNVGNQFLPANFLGRKKVEALKYLMDLLAPDNLATYYPHEYLDHSNGDIIILAVDSMRARKAIWTALHIDPRFWWLIDGRMGAHLLEVHTVDLNRNDDCERYTKSLCDDKDTIQEPCTARGIIYTSMFAGAHIAHRVREILTDGLVPHFVQHFIENDLMVKVN